jgi:hypothetical protein
MFHIFYWTNNIKRNKESVFYPSLRLSRGFFNVIPLTIRGIKGVTVLFCLPLNIGSFRMNFITPPALLILRGGSSKTGYIGNL